jgi:hypothetical protein
MVMMIIIFFQRVHEPPTLLCRVFAILPSKWKKKKVKMSAQPLSSQTNCSALRFNMKNIYKKERNPTFPRRTGVGRVDGTT